MNKAIFIGNLTRDAESKQSKSGKNYAAFTVAVNNKEYDKTETMFVRCYYLGRYENILPYLQKGAKVAVDGRIKVSAYLDKNNQPQASLDLLVSNVELCGTKGESIPQSATKTSDKPSENYTNAQTYNVQAAQKADYNLPF